MDLDLAAIADNIELSTSGLWVARANSSISYPEDGNESCYQVEEGSFWFRHRNRCILALTKHFPPPGAFFDVGGGNGYVSRALQDAGFQVVLVEPGSAGVKNAAARGIKHLVQSTLRDAEFRPQALPAIGLFDVLEHIEDDFHFLQDVQRFLRQDGRLYLTVPAFQVLWSKEDNEAGHWRRYNLRQISAVLNRAGFDVEFATYMFRFLTVPIFLIRSIPSRLGFGKKQVRKIGMRADHQPANALVNRVLDILTEHELQGIMTGPSSSLGGSSCLVVARKRESKAQNGY